MRGEGLVYRPMYTDKKTGNRRQSPTWWIQYSHNGRRYRESSKSTSEEKAHNLLTIRRGNIMQGKLPPDRLTFEDLEKMITDDYVVQGHTSTDRLALSIRHLKTEFAGEKAINIDTKRVKAYIKDRLKEGAARGSVNNELSALGRMFTLAIQDAPQLTRPHISKLKKDNARKGFFDREHFDAVMKHLPDYLKPFFHVAYVTGWRTYKELLTRQWQHVDFNNGWLRLEPGETKNKKGREFPLIPELRAVLEQQREKTEALQRATGKIIPWVFHRDGNRIVDYKRAWTTARRKAGVPGKIAHDFRRTAIRHLEMAGVSRSAAMAMTGHLTESVYNRYAIVDTKMLEDGGKRLSEYLSTFTRPATKSQS